VNAAFDSSLIVLAHGISHANAILMPHKAGFTKTGAKMAKAKKIVRREWTKADVKQLKTMAKARAGVTRISKSLKRTPGATSVMAAKLGVSLSMRP
jgi:hypothetical protein